MSLDDVDLECMLLDRLAAARDAARGNKGETVDEAITAAMEG